MTTEEYNRLVCRMNEVSPESDAALLIVQRGDDVIVSTFGAPLPLVRIKQWAYKWLGGRV